MRTGVKTRLWTCGVVAALGAAALAARSPAEAAPTTYQPTWASVDQHPPAPEWFQDAKFGIYFHWGAFSTAAYGSEWYPRNMYVGGSNENNHHKQVYGDPTGNWPYQNFLNGANDRSGNFVKFAPKLKSAGGSFDPNEWAQLFLDSGAKFAGPVAEHHDGFSMWKSSANEWNSVNKGPNLDLLALFRDAIRAKGLKLIVSEHTAYNFTGYYDHVPSQSDPSLKKLYGQLGTSAEEQLWYTKLKEVIDEAQPDILWQDFNLGQISEAQRLNFLSYYYNQANAWGKEVVATYKDGFNNRGEVLDYERGGPAGIQSPYWLTDDAVSSSSWSYVNNMSYYSSTAILHALLDRVSKNGNMLLNISPMADGTIPSGQRNILTDLGAYLKRNGEAVYATRAWSTYGEGPTQMGGGSFQQPTAGTNKDIRYTRSKGNNALYATVLGWPGNGAQVNLATLKSGFNLAGLTKVELLGNTAGSYVTLPTRNQDGSGLHITMPNQPYSSPAYVIKLSFSGTIGGPPGTTTTTTSTSTTSTSTTTTTTTGRTTTSTTTPATTTTSTTSPMSSTTTSSTTTGATTATTAGTEGCTATLDPPNQWPGGFVTNLTVTAGSAPLTGWKVTINLPSGATYTSGWNATFSGSTGTISATNMSYNGTLGSGQQTTFGFQGTGTVAGVTASCTPQ